MERWKQALSGCVLDGYTVRETALPAYDGPTVLKCVKLCEENLCGKYGTNWACPPGFDEHMDTLSDGYNSALLISRTFPCDPLDEKVVEGFNNEMTRDSATPGSGAGDWRTAGATCARNAPIRSPADIQTCSCRRCPLWASTWSPISRLSGRASSSGTTP